MILFRCPFCNRAYRVTEERIGETLYCSCKERLRVPRRSGGSAKNRTVLDWLIELIVYGGGGAFLGFCLSLLIIRAMWWGIRRTGLTMMICTGGGFLVGAVGGERGIDWIGRLIRDRDPSL